MSIPEKIRFDSTPKLIEELKKNFHFDVVAVNCPCPEGEDGESLKITMKTWMLGEILLEDFETIVNLHNFTEESAIIELVCIFLKEAESMGNVPWTPETKTMYGLSLEPMIVLGSDKKYIDGKWQTIHDEKTFQKCLALKIRCEFV